MNASRQKTVNCYDSTDPSNVRRADQQSPGAGLVNPVMHQMTP